MSTFSFPSLHCVFALRKLFFHVQLGLVALTIALALPAKLAQAATAACDPFQATLKQELWPHSSVPFNVYVLVHSPGCVPGAPDPAIPEAFCTAEIALPADGPGDTPASSLARKCERLVAAISSACGPRFDVSSVDCNPDPGQTTSFLVTDTACTGHPVPPGLGLDIAIANSVAALSTFNSGDIITDYERDTIIPGCPELAGNAVILAGQSNGQSFIPGSSPEANAVLTLPSGAQINQTVPTPNGQKATDVVRNLAERFNVTLAAIGSEVRCQVQGPILACGGSDRQAPSLSINTNVATLNKSTLGGSREGVAQMRELAQSGACPDISEDCPPLGKNITQVVPVPALTGNMAAMLACALMGFAYFMTQRRRIWIS